MDYRNHMEVPADLKTVDLLAPEQMHWTGLSSDLYIC